jgi:hypothetical protein
VELAVDQIRTATLLAVKTRGPDRFRPVHATDIELTHQAGHLVATDVITAATEAFHNFRAPDALLLSLHSQCNCGANTASYAALTEGARALAA